MTLTNVLNQLTKKELKLLLNSNKEYFYFKIAVFNVGASIKVIKTNIFKQINRNTWNGYDFIIENCSTTQYYIEQTLKNK